MSSNLIERAKLSRALGQTFGGARDLYEVLGYKRNLGVSDFYGKYQRGGVASRVVKAFPQATWRGQPIVRDEAGATADKSEFVKAFEGLYDRMKLSHYFERVDRLSLIGHYGVLYVGFNDGGLSSDPVEGRADVLYLAPYGEMSAKINTFDDNPRSPRFGLPRTYTLQGGAGTSLAGRGIVAHHSRVIHVAEALDENEVYSVPALEPIFNYLEDLDKVAGGSSEAFWLVANRGLAMIARADAELDDLAREEAKRQAEEYQHQLRRILTLQGMDVESLGSETPSCKENVDVLISLIAGAKGIPKRILLGSEAGELASSQDETNWNARVEERREQYAGPEIVRPFVGMMIQSGNLPRPRGQWWVEWTKSDGLSEKDRAEIVDKKMSALEKYGKAIGGEEIVPRNEFREMIGLEPEPEGGFDEVEDDIPDDEVE